jgi:hypothetical protein
MNPHTLTPAKTFLIINVELGNQNTAVVDFAVKQNGVTRIKTAELTETDLAICAMGQTVITYNPHTDREDIEWTAHQFSELTTKELEAVCGIATQAQEITFESFEAWASDEQIRKYNTFAKGKFTPAKLKKATGRKTITTITHRVRFRLAWWNLYSSTLHGAKAIQSLTNLVKRNLVKV